MTENQKRYHSNVVEDEAVSLDNIKLISNLLYNQSKETKKYRFLFKHITNKNSQIIQTVTRLTEQIQVETDIIRNQTQTYKKSVIKEDNDSLFKPNIYF